MTAAPYLSHVNGIRAYAIIFVILFHLTLGNEHPSVYRLANGYLGVDVFIVLMGYFLIQGFIRKQNVPFAGFIYGKIYRLLWPLSITMLCASVFGIMLLDYTHLFTMSETGVHAIIGLANVKLIKTSRDYFALDSSMNGLLHTWFIAVALQLFILSYIFYFFARKWNRKAIICILSIIAVFSYITHYCIDSNDLLLLGLSPNRAEYIISYYSPIPRIWELLAGGLVVLLPEAKNNTLKSALYVTGTALILTAVFSSPTIPPLILGTSTVMGCILIVKYVPDNRLQSLLTNRWVTSIGKISFSLYLVHMPIVVLYKGATMHTPSCVELILILGIIFFLGAVFWFLIEKRKFSGIITTACMLAALAINLILQHTNGLKEYWHKESNNIAAQPYTHIRRTQQKELLENYDSDCLITHAQAKFKIIHTTGQSQTDDTASPFLQIGIDGEAPTFALFGDSHAFMCYPGLDVICKKHNVSGVLIDTLMLPFCHRAKGNPKDSYAFNENKLNSYLRWLEGQNSINTQLVIFSWYWATNILHQDSNGNSDKISVSANMLRMKEFLIRMQNLNKRVVLLTPFPRLKTNNVLMYARYRHKFHLNTPLNQEYTVSRGEYQSQWGECITYLRQFESEGLCHVIDPTPTLFENDICLPFKGTDIYFRDCNHISANTSIKVMGSIQDKLIPLLQSPHDSQRSLHDANQELSTKSNELNTNNLPRKP